MSKFFGPRDQGAVARHLVVLDRLSVRYNRNVEYGLVSDLARCLIGFLNNAIDRGACRPLRLLTKFGKSTFQTFDLFPSLLEMVLQAGLKTSVRRFVDHFRQRLLNLLLRVIDVLQLMEKKVLHRANVLCKYSHRLLLLRSAVTSADLMPGQPRAFRVVPIGLSQATFFLNRSA